MPTGAQFRCKASDAREPGLRSDCHCPTLRRMPRWPVDRIALMPHARPDRLITIVRRGLAKRCPRCGDGPIFRRWYTLHHQCSACQLPFESSEGDTWAFMYLSTAFMTGLI